MGGVDGMYMFTGLIAGNYQIALDQIPVGFQEAPIDNVPGDDLTDNDGNNYTFTLTDPFSNPTNENGTGDQPDDPNYPDDHNDLSIDIGLVQFDYGDLPASFPTTSADNGANHVLEPGMWLGAGVDPELDGPTTAEADGDDLADTDDEDGVELVSPLIPGDTACIRVTTVLPNGLGYFRGWIDFNGDGDFAGDANELLNFVSLDGTPIIADEITYTAPATDQLLCFVVPEDATFEGGETHFRYRFSREPGMSFDGEADSGCQ